VAKVKQGSYVLIQEFMVNDLMLKGNELLIYAIIFGFSQDGTQCFSGSLQYLANWTNSTRQGVLKSLKSLCEKGFIEKKSVEFNGVNFCEYRTTELNEGVKQSLMGCETEFNGGVKQSLTGRTTEFNGGVKLSLHNNLVYNLEDKLKDNKEDNKESKGTDKPPRPRFIPPTLDEVSAYCLDRDNGLDAQHFIDYYETRGWVLSNGKKMVDWKAAIRTWEKRSKEAHNGSTSKSISESTRENPKKKWNIRSALDD
jgi:predicted transcriptional regulator